MLVHPYFSCLAPANRRLTRGTARYLLRVNRVLCRGASYQTLALFPCLELQSGPFQLIVLVLTTVQFVYNSILSDMLIWTAQYFLICVPGVPSVTSFRILELANIS